MAQGGAPIVNRNFSTLKKSVVYDHVDKHIKKK